MCTPMDAITAVTQAAQDLTLACEGCLGSAARALHSAFDRTLGEAIPADMMAVLGRLPAGIDPRPIAARNVPMFVEPPNI